MFFSTEWATWWTKRPFINESMSSSKDTRKNKASFVIATIPMGWSLGNNPPMLSSVLSMPPEKRYSNWDSIGEIGSGFPLLLSQSFASLSLMLLSLWFLTFIWITFLIIPSLLEFYKTLCLFSEFQSQKAQHYSDKYIFTSSWLLLQFLRNFWFVSFRKFKNNKVRRFNNQFWKRIKYNNFKILLISLITLWISLNKLKSITKNL